MDQQSSSESRRGPSSQGARSSVPQPNNTRSRGDHASESRLVSNINAQPASIHRLFRHHRDYPALPNGFDWEAQLRHYSPKGLMLELPIRRLSQEKHKYGYVFCHRGLYVRALGIIENSASAIENGIRQGFFLHEMDAFIFERLEKAFIAHDKVPRRITNIKETWPFKDIDQILSTNLVNRGVNEVVTDFASSYRETSDTVPGVLSTLWKETTNPTGQTLQIDLRDRDFAKAIPFYIFHLSQTLLDQGVKRQANQELDLAWNMFRAAMLKGYTVEFATFSALHKAIQEESVKAYGKDVFRLEYLPLLPPLIMVFSAGPLVDLVESRRSDKDRAKGRPTYDQVYSVFKEQVGSFVHVERTSYSFILEIAHSGLGLGYDRKTNTAMEPLEGTSIHDKDVIFESCVDRVMIDVSLELRHKYSELLFGSCTRLPDVNMKGKNYKASFADSKLRTWNTGEKGISTHLRAKHGGLYPQSHLVVADNPAAEIAARTWIDERYKLDRRQLLRVHDRPWMPYNQWLAQAGPSLVDVMAKIDSTFQVNEYGGAIESNDADHDWNAESRSGMTNEDVRGWLDKVQRNLAEVAIESDVDDHDHNVVEVATRPAEQKADKERAPSPTMSRSATVIAKENTQKAFLALAAYRAAETGNETVLRECMARGADINMSMGLFVTGLAEPASAKHCDTVATLLLGKAGGAGFSRSWYTALEREHMSGFRNIDKRLLSRVAQLDHMGGIWPTILRAALLMDSGFDNDYAHVGYLRDVVDLLVQTGSCITRLGCFDTPLIAACCNGHSKIVKLLLDNGADINLTGGQHHSALQGAVHWDQSHLIKNLVAKGADIDAQGGSEGSPLKAACAGADDDMVKLLLTLGANPKVKGTLLVACRARSATIAMPLVDREAPISKEEQYRLERDGAERRVKVVKRLLNAGAVIDFPRQEFRPEINDVLEKFDPSYRKRAKTRGNQGTRKDFSLDMLNDRPYELYDCGCLICLIIQAGQEQRLHSRPRPMEGSGEVRLTKW
ncbi:hypothetical protein E8E14_009615 [Neopestalotiopsis sp. 37M]|nr:hypothetical protein E8E14_009615 [Neopestalotiopsis sp. 37M]